MPHHTYEHRFEEAAKKANPNRNTYIDNLMDEVTISGGTGGGDLTQIPPIVGGNNQDMFQLNLAGTTPEWNSGGGGGFSLKYEKLGGMSDVNKMGMMGGLGSIASGLIGRGKRRDEQTDAAEEYKTMRTAYQELDTSNLYANVKNQYRNLENTFEDLTINQQQAQFEAQQAAQSRANIMEGFRGAAGGCGIAGLAQAMANQAQLQTQKASASIGLQEAQQQRLMATEGARIQMAERAGEAQAESMRLAGAEQARGLEWQKTGTMLGMAQQRKGMADQAIAESNAAIAGGVGQVAGSLLTGGLL